MTPSLKRVLFVCLGNSCRSQMAEAFARAYGSDVLIAASAGLTPASGVAGDTSRAMAEKGINLRDHFPKSLRHLGRAQFDLVINMSGYDLPDNVGMSVRTWDVPDPVFLKFSEHCEVRDAIEKLVMMLVLELRREQNTPQLRPFGSGLSASARTRRSSNSLSGARYRRDGCAGPRYAVASRNAQFGVVPTAQTPGAAMGHRSRP